MDGGTILKVGGHKCTSRNYGIENCDVAIIESDVINYVSMFKECFTSPQPPLSKLHLRYADLST